VAHALSVGDGGIDSTLILYSSRPGSLTKNPCSRSCIPPDGEIRQLRETYEAMADYFGLAEAARKVVIPSGSMPLYRGRTGRGLTFLHKAYLVDRPRRTHY
jgi:restriction endonuclease Mrr